MPTENIPARQVRVGMFLVVDEELANKCTIPGVKQGVEIEVISIGEHKAGWAVGIRIQGRHEIAFILNEDESVPVKLTEDGF